MLWILDIGKNHFNFNVYDGNGISFLISTFGLFLLSFIVHIIRGSLLLKDVQDDNLDSNFFHVCRMLVLFTALIIVSLVCFLCSGLIWESRRDAQRGIIRQEELMRD